MSCNCVARDLNLSRVDPGDYIIAQSRPWKCALVISSMYMIDTGFQRVVVVRQDDESMDWIIGNPDDKVTVLYCKKDSENCAIRG